MVCGNEGSLTHWARPEIKPASSQRQCQVFYLQSLDGNLEWLFFEWPLCCSAGAWRQGDPLETVLITQVKMIRYHNKTLAEWKERSQDRHLRVCAGHCYLWLQPKNSQNHMTANSVPDQRRWSSFLLILLVLASQSTMNFHSLFHSKASLIQRRLLLLVCQWDKIL